MAPTAIRPFSSVVLLMAVLTTSCARVTATMHNPSPSRAVNRAATEVFEPDAVAFWTTTTGLLVGTLTTLSCRSGQTPCPAGLIEKTTNGGRTWSVVERVTGPLDNVSVVGNKFAWVTRARCGPASPNACGTKSLLLTSDAGKHWSQVKADIPITSISPVSAATAWAVAGAGDIAFPRGTSLVETTDGGRNWAKKGVNPCTKLVLSPWAVSFHTASAGWALCATEEQTQGQTKALVMTTNAGATWRVESLACPLQPKVKPIGKLACLGYVPGLRFLPDGHGWLWTANGTMEATTDGGHIWSDIGHGVIEFGLNIAISAWPVSGKGGVALVWMGNAQQWQLLTTRDGGTKFREVAHWAGP